MPLDFNKIKELNKIKPVETKPTTGLDFDAIRQKNLPTAIPTEPGFEQRADYTQYAQAFMEPVGITKQQEPTVTTDIGKVVLQGPTSILADPSKARIVTPTQQKLGQFAIGVRQALPMLTQQAPREELIRQRTEEMKLGAQEGFTPYQAGRIAGSIPKYAVGYAALGPAVEAAAAPVVSKLPSIAQPFVTEMAKDITIGAPLALTEELAEGKTGKDLVQSMTLNTAIDAVANIVFLGAGKIISGLRKQDVVEAVSKNIQSDEPVKDIGQRVLDELEATYKETLPKFGTPYYQAADLTRPTEESLERISRGLTEQRFQELVKQQPMVSDVQLDPSGFAFEPKPLAQDIRALEPEYEGMLPTLTKKTTAPMAPSPFPRIAEGVLPEIRKVEVGEVTLPKVNVTQQRKSLMDSLEETIGVSKYADKKGLNESVDSLINNAVETGRISPVEAEKLFNKIVESGVVEDTGFYEAYKPLKDEIKNTRLYASDLLKADFPENEYNAFRKANIGNVKLTAEKNAMRVDSFYQELSGRHPELFPADITSPRDQLERIADIQKSIAKSETNLSQFIRSDAEFEQFARDEFYKKLRSMESEINRSAELPTVKKVEAPSVKQAEKLVYKAETGKPFRATMYKGIGERPGTVYTNVEYPVLGKVNYLAPTEQSAKKYGKEIVQQPVNLQNPFVINNDSEWRAITEEAGWEFPNIALGDKEEVVRQINDLQNLIKSKGYDGVVVNVPEWESKGKTMQRMFGHSQVVDFKVKPSVQKSVMADTPRMSMLQSFPESQREFINKLKGTPEQAIKITPTKVPAEGFYKRSDIVNNLSEALDIPIEKGRFRQKAYGIFKVRPEIIRVKNKKQLDTVLHEAGHYIDKKLNFSDIPNFADELYRIGLKQSGPDYSRDDIIKEGVAEFFADYGHTKDMARKSAPKLFEYIDGVMKQNPELDNLFEVTRQGIQNYRNLDPVGNVLSNVQMTPKRRSVPKAQELFNSFYDNWVDDLAPINRAIKNITGGEAIKDTENAYILHRLAKTSGVGKAEVAFEKGVVDAQGNIIGKGMNDILKPVADDFEEFIGYAVAKRAKELEQRGIQTGMDVGSVDKVLQKFEGNKVFNDALDELYGFQDTVLLELQKSGMITEEAFNSIKEMNKNYIPFYRVMENASGVGPSKGQPIKRIKGSEKDILNPINSIMKNTYAIYNIIDKNNANRALFDLSGKYEGFGKIFDKIPTPMRTTTFNLGDLEKQLRDLGVEGDIDQMVSIFRPDAFSNRDDIVKIFRDGKPEYYQIFDPDLAQTLAYSNANQRNLLTKILGAPARVLRAGATALNPDFVGRNIFRDTVMASVMSKYGFIPVVDSLAGISDVLGKTDLYQKALASGALNNSIVSLDRNYLSKDMRKMLAQDQAGRVKNIIKHPVDMIRALSELSEEATRMGQFKKATKKLGMSDEAITRAALETRDLLDFHRAGRMGRNVNQYIPFFNATIQGTDKVARAFKENPVGMTAKATAAITLPSIALYMMNKGNPEYENLSQYEKDMYWNIPTNMYSHLTGQEKEGPTTVYRIPKPFELGVMYGTTPERLLDYIHDDDPEAFDGLRRRYFEAFAPDVFPTIFKLPLELQANYSSFYDSPIVPESKQELEPAEQYGARTSESAKFLGRIFNQSPYKIDYAIRGLTGGTGPMAIGAAETGLSKLGVLDVPEKPAVSLPGKLPILRGLTVSEYAQPKQIEDFYERFNELTTQYNTARAKNRLEEMPVQDIQQYRIMSRISSRMSALNKEKTRIYQDMQMSGEQKRQALHDIEKQQLELISMTEGK